MASKKMNDKIKDLSDNMAATEEVEISTVDVEDEGQTEVEIKDESASKETKSTKKDANTTSDKEDATPEDKSKEDKPRRKRSSQATKALELEIEKQKQIATEYQDKYKRLLAEFENARARNEKESSRMFDVGAKDVLEKLLPVVDNFERALQAVPEEDKERGFEQGVDKIYRQLMVTLDGMGVAPMDAEGKEFDPDLHNAVMHIVDEAYEDNIVVEEMQKGYMYKESVLRHSMVKVAN